MGDVAAIILAAGRGTRFGPEPKLLAQIAGKAMVRHVAEAALASSTEPVIMVTGYRADDVCKALEGLPIQFVNNASFGDGLSTSLKAGFSALPPHIQAAVILLGDMPRIGTVLIDSLVTGWQEMGNPSALIPTYNGRRGNPVVLSSKLKTAIEQLSGDVGAGPILRERSDVLEWPTEDRAVLQDVDTEQGLAQVQFKSEA